MMDLYAADDHLMALTDSIDADFHAHSFLQVCISLQSSFDMEIDSRHFFTKGIMIDSNIRHRFNGNHNPLLFLLIDSTSDLAVPFRECMGDEPVCEISGEKIDRINAYLASHCGSILNRDHYTEFLSQILALLNINYSAKNDIDPRIQRIIDSLRDCEDPEHSVDILAKQVSLSGSRLSHLFKESTGISLSGYLVLHKLQKAIYLIFMGMSVTDASLTAGFDSPSHFASTSKRLLGMSATNISKDSVFLKVSRYQ